MPTNDHVQCSPQQHDNLDLFISQDHSLSLFSSLTPVSPSSSDSDLISFEAIEVHKNQILQTLIPELQPLLLSRLPFKRAVRKYCFTKNMGQCSICQQHIPKNFRTPKLQCKHTFHHSCLRKWYQQNSSCPLCRKEIGS